MVMVSPVLSPLAAKSKLMVPSCGDVVPAGVSGDHDDPPRLAGLPAFLHCRLPPPRPARCPSRSCRTPAPVSPRRRCRRQRRQRWWCSPGRASLHTLALLHLDGRVEERACVIARRGRVARAHDEADRWVGSQAVVGVQDHRLLDHEYRRAAGKDRADRLPGDRRHDHHRQADRLDRDGEPPKSNLAPEKSRNLSQRHRSTLSATGFICLDLSSLETDIQPILHLYLILVNRFGRK